GSELEFDAGGRIRAGDRCLQLDGDNQLIAGDCRGGPRGYFLFDDEGHLWAGVPPAPAPGMAGDHTLCLVGIGGSVRADLCGATRDQRWALGRPPVTTLRADLGLSARARSIQLADVNADGFADLCRIQRGGLRCSLGDGTGRFGETVRLDAVAQPL